VIRPVDYFLVVWFVLALASALYVGWDQFRHNPEPTVMKWGFILVTLYMGPLGWLLYVLADKEPRPGEHESFIRPLWKQGVGSTIHCVAGDATGIILAAAATATLGLPMWLDLIVEYCAGFAFGLFIFQSLFMKSLMAGTPMDGAQPNYFTINGRSYPATDTIRMRVGQTLKVRFIGSNNGFIHPMHIHGGPFEVVAVDGQTLQPSARYFADTLNVGHSASQRAHSCLAMLQSSETIFQPSLLSSRTYTDHKTWVTVRGFARFAKTSVRV
jgi:hypothetical protein